MGENHLKWLAGMVGGSVSTFANIDQNGDGKIQTGEIITAVTSLTNEAFDDLPQGFSFNQAIEDAKDPLKKAEAVQECVIKFDLKTDKVERSAELVFELIIELISIDRKLEEVEG